MEIREKLDSRDMLVRLALLDSQAYLAHQAYLEITQTHRITHDSWQMYCLVPIRDQVLLHFCPSNSSTFRRKLVQSDPADQLDLQVDVPDS